MIRIAGCLLAAGIYACAGSQASHEISVGRVALLTGNPAQALTHFEKAAALDATHRSTLLQESPWTYVARAHYQEKQYDLARQALVRALAINQKDAVALLYLGLIEARAQANDKSRGQILLGLQAIDEHVDYLKHYTAIGEFWDPSGQLSAELKVTIKNFSTAQHNWVAAIPQIEVLALRLEIEIDAAQRDQSYEHRGGGGSGDM